MIRRSPWNVVLAVAVAALGCARAVPRPTRPVPPEVRAAQATLAERVDALDALVTELAPASGSERPGNLTQDPAARFAAAWNGVIDAGEAAMAAFHTYDPESGKRVRAWLEQYVRRAGTTALSRVPAGAEAGPVASGALFNLLAFRQRQAEVEAMRGLAGIWWDVAGPNAGKPGLFTPGPCPDETHAQAPDADWAAGCRFLFRLEVPPAGQSEAPVAVARGVAGPVDGVELRLQVGQRPSFLFRAQGREPEMYAVPGWPAPEEGDALYPAVQSVAAQDFGPADIVFDPSQPIPEGMTRPTRISGPDPIYTRAAFLARVQGSMKIQCVISTDGWIYDCRVVQGLALMNQAVLDALVARRYRPVTFHGKEISCDYVFNINLVMPGR